MLQAIEKEKRLRLSKLEEQDKALRYGLVRWVDDPNGKLSITECLGCGERHRA
jgi:hypothetical protein